MFIGITGTPGTGKSSVSGVLKDYGYIIVDLNKISIENDFIIRVDERRDSNIVDIERLNNFIKEFYSDEKYVILDGHLSHLLKCVEKVIILRCFPIELKRRLILKKWNLEKVRENVEAEILDVILCEALENTDENDIFEMDTTDLSVEDIVSNVLEIINNDFKPMKKYKIGTIDWSGEILKDF